ncbi:hypothetical protein EHQ76_09170 [Leptospira barantonii]|uniref:Serine protease n=1 Tax=Leptospira barantonii TaxID=2023184 RepID=A0A5F2BE90_9LEPT|nr:hypothetical protein [Leptospira barantonii]TGM03802.1 hypothetical protein EHQ76_09170 [Leptospira barantonii]
MSIYKEALDMSKLLYAKLNTISLHSLDEKLIINSAGSACIVNYKNKRILLTAAHNLFNEEEKNSYRKKVGIKIGITPDFETTEYYLPNYEWLDSIIIDRELTDEDIKQFYISRNQTDTIDFAFAIVPEHVTPRDEVIDYRIKEVHYIEKAIIPTTFSIYPNQEDLYFFAGLVKTKLLHDQKKFSSTEKAVENIKFLYTSINSNFYCFEIPEIIREKKDFAGCSGAPIFNSQGEIVSLFVKGYRNTNRILGVNLQKILKSIEQTFPN